MAIPAIPPLGGAAGLAGVAPTTPTAPTVASTAAPAVAAPGDGGFANVLGSVVDGAQALQGQAKTLALQAVTGNLTDIHRATIAATRASVTLELVAAVRNKGIEAFNEIMRMQA